MTNPPHLFQFMNFYFFLETTAKNFPPPPSSYTRNGARVLFANCGQAWLGLKAPWGTFGACIETKKKSINLHEEVNAQSLESLEKNKLSGLEIGSRSSKLYKRPENLILCRKFLSCKTVRLGCRNFLA